MAEPVQASDRWRKEVFTTALIHPRASTKLKLVSLIFINSIVETDVALGMIFTLSLIDKRIHARAVLEGFLLGRGEDAIACPAF